jgi:hypothetical protein
MNTFLLKFEIFTTLANSRQSFETPEDLLNATDEAYEHLTKGIDMSDLGETTPTGKFEGMN